MMIKIFLILFFVYAGQSHKVEESRSCGVPIKAIGTVVRGKDFTRGDFPWIVALYQKRERQLPAYFCAGTIISDHHVLTAAHCLEGLKPREITVLFGAHDLNNPYEVDRVAKAPSRFIVHDHWNPETVQFDADIAIIVMPEKIVFSTYIRPVCLWKSSGGPTAFVGTVAAWGQSENRSIYHETIPKKLSLPIHKNDDCFYAHFELGQFSSKRTFCAGLADGRGPCSGDSGGGFFVLDENVYYLKGVVSSSLMDINGDCLLEKYTIYTDVLQFKSWIDDKVKNSLDDVGVGAVAVPSKIIKNVRCGKPVQRSGLIVHGNSFNRGEMPWMVAIFQKQLNRFFCGGTLISAKHILSVANCFNSKGNNWNLTADELNVALGAFDLEKRFETGTTYKSPQDIISHPDWKTNTESFDADIAILVMADEIEFSRFIIPICLWSSQSAPSAQKGITAGWGYGQVDADTHENIPKKIKVPIHSNEDCFLRSLALAQISSARTFCAGAADGTGPCKGDSGNGLFISHENAFYLRGMASSGLPSRRGDCDLKKYTIYTDVLKFIPWIDSILNKDQD